MTGETAGMMVLLDDVHAALLAADYARLAPLAAQIEAEIDALERSRVTATLHLVAVKARRNMASLQAAQRGFRAARRRMQEIAAAQSGLITYDSAGRRSAPHPTGDLAKRF